MAMAFSLNSAWPSRWVGIMRGKMISGVTSLACESGSLSAHLIVSGDEKRDWDGSYSLRPCFRQRIVGGTQATLLSRTAVSKFQFVLLERGIIKTRNLLKIRGNGASNARVNTPTEAAQKEVLSRGQLLWRAAKLPIYSVAIVPLSVGGAAAFWQTGDFNAGQYWLMFWSSILIITWLNLSNDAYDSDTGVDKNKRESVVSITGSQKGVLWAANICLTIGFLGLVLGASRASDMRVAGLLAAAIGCGYAYQCPPFRLGYLGLGEPLCFLAFGPFATTAFYLSQAPASGTVALPVTLTVTGVSVLVGITTALILFCSHFHQIEGDTMAGKMSPLVRIGTENGAKVVQVVVIVLYSFMAVLAAVKALPLSCALLSLMTMPIGKLLLDFIRNNHLNREVIFMAKYYAVRLHVGFNVALALGLYLASQLNQHFALL